MQSLDNFLLTLNELDSKIKYTIEIEKEGILHFLDVKLIKNNCGNKLERTVHSKQSRCNKTISFDCNSPSSYEIAAYRFYVKSGLEVCMDKYLEKEIGFIKQISIGNGSPPQYINRFVDQAKQPRKKNELSLRKFIYCTFEYISQLYERLRYALLKYNINLIAEPPAKLKELIHSKIDPIPDYEKVGVYVIPFNTEHQKSLFYICMASRKFKEMLNEHLSVPF